MCYKGFWSFACQIIIIIIIIIIYPVEATFLKVKGKNRRKDSWSGEGNSSGKTERKKATLEVEPTYLHTLHTYCKYQYRYGNSLCLNPKLCMILNMH